MPLASRMLVSFEGSLPEETLIRYAAMVARIHQPEAVTQRRRQSRRGSQVALARSTPSDRWQTHRRTAASEEASGGVPEIRFVSLLPNREREATSPRTALTVKVRQHFSRLPQCGPVNVDLLKGRALARLSILATDFDTDLMLMDHPATSRRKRARVAIEMPCAVWLVPSDWAPVVRRILVPIDFSSRAAANLRAAVELASRFRPAKCIALHVDRYDSRFNDDTLPQQRRRELTNEFQRFVSAIDARGVRIEPLFVRSHRVDRAIERAAAEHATDLTVMSCRRRGRVVSAIHPSLTEAVICESRGPVLLLKTAEQPLGLIEAWQKSWHSGDVPQFS